MDGYLAVKTVHVLSATVLFGTGLGIAFFCFVGLRCADDRMALFAARTTCVADMLFTLTAGIAQPLTGLWLVLGWPAFIGLVAVFWLMVVKPA